MLDPVAVIVPVLDRPAHVAPLVESYLASGAAGTLYFVVDDDDPEELTAIRAAQATHGDERVKFILADGLVTFPRKVNRAYRVTTEPWLLLAGDDVVFHRGWAWKAQRIAGDRYHLVATDDRLSPRVAYGAHATHPLIRRSWVEASGASWDGPGVLCHEGYRHWFVDDEWSTKARVEDVFTYARHAVVEHLNPLEPTADRVYALAWAARNRDQRTYQERLARFVPTASTGPLPI